MCESPAASIEFPQESHNVGSVGVEKEVPAAGVLAMDLGIKSYRLEDPKPDESAKILAYGAQKDHVATITFTIRDREMEIVVETPASEWKSLAGVRNNIGHTTHFKNISHYDKLAEKHDTFKVESRYRRSAPDNEDRLLEIGFQFNDTELLFDLKEKNGEIASGGKYDLALQEMLREHAGPAYIADEMHMALAVLSDSAVAPHMPKELSPLASTISAMSSSEIRKFMALESPVKSLQPSDSVINSLVDDSVDTIGDYFICGGACVGAAGGGASCTSILTCAAWAAAVGTCINCFDEGGVFEAFSPDPVFVPLPGGGSGGCTDVTNLPNATICGDVVMCEYDADTDIITCW